MKRISMMTALLLMAVMSLQAQSLQGKWTANAEKDADGDTSKLVLIFNQGNKAQMEMQMEHNEPEVGSFTCTMILPGTYQQKGNKVTLNYQVNQSTVRLDKMRLVGEYAQAIEKNPETKKAVESMMQAEMDKELKKQFKDEVPFDGELTIKKLTNTTLELDDDGDTMVFTRVH